MPRVDDAIVALTDPELRGADPARDGLVPVRGNEVVGRLQQLGMSEDDARVLAAEAIKQLGGQDRSKHVQRRGLRPGRLFVRTQYVLDYWIPASAVREG